MRETAANQMYQRVLTGDDPDKQRALVYQELKKHGYRLTNQRKIIIDVILEKDCSCCKDIFYEVIKRDPSIGVATVYRMMKSLEEIGAIDRRQMFKICFDTGCERPNVCSVTFEDGTTLVLNAKEWAGIVEAGLRSAGYQKSVREVEIGKCRSCDCSL